MNSFLSWILVWIITALVVMVGAYILPGVKVKNFWVALLVSIVLALVDILIKPFLLILTLPFTIITFGLFIFVINALMVMLTSAIVPDFKVHGFLNALLFSIIISIARVILLAVFSI